MMTLTFRNKWRPPRKSGLTLKTNKASVVCYAIIQSSQWLSELTHSSSEASIFLLSLSALFIQVISMHNLFTIVNIEDKERAFTILNTYKYLIKCFKTYSKTMNKLSTK